MRFAHRRVYLRSELGEKKGGLTKSSLLEKRVPGRPTGGGGSARALGNDQIIITFLGPSCLFCMSAVLVGFGETK